MTEPADADQARRLHYGDFYGLSEPDGDHPVVLVVGNCQAESIRIMLDAGDIRAIRMPAVHELVAADMPHLDRWLARTSFLVSQPVRDDYHGLPIGTRQLIGRMPSSARSALVPVIRFAGLYPAHAIVRPPMDLSLVPPIVEYHDLRLLAEAAGRNVPSLDVDRVRAIAGLSRNELRSRETRHGTVLASDLFAEPSFDLMRTLNHPGNPIFSAVAGRVREQLGLAEAAVDPGRPLLTSVLAPREQVVIDSWSLDESATDSWTVGGSDIPADHVREAHLDWYADHPEVVAAGLTRHADSLALLGMR